MIPNLNFDRNYCGYLLDRKWDADLTSEPELDSKRILVENVSLLNLDKHTRDQAYMCN